LSRWPGAVSVSQEMSALINASTIATLDIIACWVRLPYFRAGPTDVPQ
jgi:hypothetical protein